jgi:hypothetical protein
MKETILLKFEIKEMEINDIRDKKNIKYIYYN